MPSNVSLVYSFIYLCSELPPSLQESGGLSASSVLYTQQLALRLHTADTHWLGLASMKEARAPWPCLPQNEDSYHFRRGKCQSFEPEQSSQVHLLWEEERVAHAELHEGRIPLILSNANLPMPFPECLHHDLVLLQNEPLIDSVSLPLMKHLSPDLIGKPHGTLLFTTKINRLLLLTNNR